MVLKLCYAKVALPDSPIDKKFGGSVPGPQGIAPISEIAVKVSCCSRTKEEDNKQTGLNLIISTFLEVIYPKMSLLNLRARNLAMVIL
jgi:hypothetical protein